MNASTQNTVTTLPLSALFLSPENARQSERKDIDSLADCIASMGLLQNLVVHVDAEQEGRYGVSAGGRRFLALTKLLESGRIADSYPVDVKIVADDAMAASIAENTQRQAMHAADEYAAIQRMTEEGYSVDRIADLLGVTPLVVERRLMLSKAHPSLIELFRQDKISTDSLIALCSTSDQERQLRAYEAVSKGYYYNQASRTAALRKLVLDSEIDCSTDKRFALIGGVQVFEAAGGIVRRDLFASPDQNGGFTNDAALLEELVTAKLEEAAAAARSEGWSWVEVVAEGDKSVHRMGSVRAGEPVIPEEVQAQIDALDAEDKKLDTEREALEDEEGSESEDDGMRLQTIYDRQQDIADKIEAIKEALPGSYSDEVKAAAGAVVCIDNGVLSVWRGLVRSEDRAAAAEATGQRVSGGRETAAAGRKDNAISDALRRSLLGRRNQAAQMALSQNPRVAKVLLAMSLADLVGGHRWRFGFGDRLPSDLCFGQSSEGTRCFHPITDGEADTLNSQLSEQMEATLDGLPEDRATQWDWFAAKSDSELDAIVAYGVAASLTLQAGHEGFTAKLLEAMSFDMSAHMTTTADNYFNRIPKPLMVEAIADAGKLKGDEDREWLLTLKKGELAGTAEARVHGTSWVPALIRSPAPKVAAPPKAAKAPKKEATTPAKAKAGKTAAAKKPAGKTTTKAKAKPSKG